MQGPRYDITGLPARIQDARIKAGYETPAALAKVLGVSKQTVYLWEDGPTKDLRIGNLFALADVLRVHVEWLAFGRGPRDRRPGEVEMSPEAIQLAAKLGTLETGFRDHISMVIEDFVRLERRTRVSRSLPHQP